MNILVLCTGNSARSILLEAILNKEGAGRVRAWSAGSKPAGRVHPHSLRLLEGKGIDTSGLRSKNWNEFARRDAPKMDLVVTVCGSAAGEVCPMWPGAPLRAHWGVEDPAAAPEAEQQAAFDDAWDILSARAHVLLSQPFESMPPEALRSELARIGTI